MSELIYLYAAYTIIWTGVFLYLLKLHMTQRRIKSEINRLREIIDGKKT